VPDDAAAIPAMACHYAAILRAWSHVAPETSVHSNQAELRLGLGNKMFVAIFGCRTKNWSLHSIEVRRGKHTARRHATRVRAVHLS
jgi:hypothetical protein